MYTEREIRSFIEGYISILTKSLDANKLVRDIDAISEDEKETLNTFNATEHEYDIPANTTLYSLFEEQATKNADKVCVIADNKEITYKDFRAFAERIDGKIRSVTSNEKSVIAVICERSFEMYGAVYGIIRGGNAYLPIDPNYPQERIDYILSNSDAKAVVAQDKFTHLVTSVPCINATEILHSDYVAEKTEILANEEDTAYVIYTSGSTGNPKGAKISHKSAVNRILWMHEFYPLEENDVILQKTPYTFDVSVWELFWWGITGRTLCASKPDEHFLPAKILDEAKRNKVTHLHFVPSVFDLFLTYLENNKEEQSKFETVKYVFLSGEALTANHINRFYSIYDYNKVSLHNLYGPTECAVDVSYYPCVPADVDPVPIGKPIYNTQLHIVDKNMNLTPIGVTGELCIAGVNVGQGYLNNEELTNEKFIDNPYGEGKLYKTGDLAYWREDGQIIYCGRNDFQVKINGQRIELGEIENAITNVDGVVQCAVIVREQYICAFYTGKETEEKELRSILNTTLPRYMVPHVFTYMESLPMTVSGKLDRKALPQTDFNNINTEAEYIAPETEEEKVLAEVVCDVLRTESVNMLDNFFNVGGDSILAIYVVSELEEKGYELHVADIMQSETLADVAKAMKVSTGEEPGDYGFVSLDATKVELSELNEIYLDDMEYVYSLTPSQEGIYAQYFQSKETKTYQLQNVSKIDKEADIEILRKSVEMLSVRHEVLKSAFTVLKSTGAIKQVILENRKPEFKVLSYNQPYTKDVLDRIVNEDAEKAMDLQKDSLFRVTVAEFTDARYIVMHSHHIILDGWCLPVIINDLQRYYSELAKGRAAEEVRAELKKEAEENTTYAEYANWIRKQDTEAVGEYWKSLLAESESSHIYGKEKKDNVKNENIITFVTPVSEEAVRNVEKLAKESKVTANSVFECAF
jgi:amino acid adenylation domain-containing protein